MTARRRAATIAAVGIAPLALTVLGATPATAHGSLTDPVSRVAACHAEGPENPRSAACKAAIAASGTQAFYDWNEVNIGDAAGRHREIIPDGKLCSAGRDKYKGLDLSRTDWPASPMTAGDHTFGYKGTAPHKGSFELYITKDGYDPSKPLAWDDLESKPFAKVTDPTLDNGTYVFSGKVPEKSGRHLVYSIWQRSDSPEAFYSCSDVIFGGAGGGSSDKAAPAAPTDEQIAANRPKSTVDHDGHGGNGPDDAQQPTLKSADGSADGAERPGDDEAPGRTASGANAGENTGGRDDTEGTAANEARPNSSGTENVSLAETGGGDSTTTLAMGGAAAVALGAAALFVSVRRRTPGGRRRG